jgi:two-component system CheB/CheR fusion protein
MKKTRAPSSAPTNDAIGSPGSPRAFGPFPIVGIGASAGGLEAFSALLKHLPLDTGMAFVLVQHLDPEHESALTQVLARETSLPVNEVTDNLRVEPNHVYVIPPNTNLSIAAGVLTLGPRPKTRKPHRAIDFFLEALAQDQRERAIGVILSGTATDGTLGLEAIKAEGGITFAQDDSARYDSMPRSAVAAGCVDFVLSPPDIANELSRIAKHPALVSGALGPLNAPEHRSSATWPGDDDTRLPAGDDDAPGTTLVSAEADTSVERVAASTENGFKKILLLLRNHAGVDFSLYKSSTIQRRIARRMVLTKHETPADYAQFLRGHAKEIDALYSDVLISVTSFFRNPESFEVLQRAVFPQLLAQRSDDPVRVWVLGCSTGQEAYSIAMAFMEAADKTPRSRRLQVFATDLNDALLEKARHGFYARSLAQDLSELRLRRFFVEEEGGYRIRKSLRDMVVFARQNVISDPPFSRMDLISCRNVLIYFEPGLHKKVMPVFHYALKPGGFLYLGASESTAAFTELFEPVDKKHKIYAKKVASTPPIELPAGTSSRQTAASNQKPAGPFGMPGGRGGAIEGFRTELSAQREADRVTVNEFAPPSVLINTDLQIMQFRGPTSAFLEPPRGKASFDVLKMARPGLMLPLRAAINQAKKTNKTTRKERVRVEQDGNSRLINLEVLPLKNLQERCFLVVFEDAADPGAPAASRASRARRRFPEPPPPDAASRRAEARRIGELETELAETRDYVQSFREQHEAAHEELQASNEEVQSANEELQSTNEELETSKEELESANEELTTLNEEMANRNTELNGLNSDLLNIQTSGQLAIVLLGRDLTIRRFSLQAEKLFNLVAADIGRPISHVRHRLHLPDLDPFVSDVVSSVRARELETQDQDGRWYVLRVHPYMTIDNRVGGAVLVLFDIDALKRSEHEVRASEERFRTLVAQVHDYAIFRTDERGRATTWNQGVRRILGFNESDFIGQDVTAAIFTPEDILNRVPEKELDDATKTGHADSTRWMRRKNGERFFAVGTTTALSDGARLVGFSRILRDQTEIRQAEESRDQLARIVEFSDDAIVGMNPDGVIATWNRGAERLFGFSAPEAIGQSVMILVPPERSEEERRILADIRGGKKTESYETVRRCKDGRLVDVSLTVSPVRDDQGRIVGASKIAREITERKRAEDALRDSHTELRSQAEELTHFNRVAVGRELRMIDLKKEVNALRQRLGESGPYALAFEPHEPDVDG